MMTKRVLYSAIVAVGLAGHFAASPSGISARQATADAVAIDNDDVGGVVTSAKGPEAGVWVIAETRDLPTGFRKIVVTDDRGRYVVPDLPKANYTVWVRGYGLVDSPKMQTAPGKILNLSVVEAPSPRVAAEYYPGDYWYALLQVPAKSEFPGTGPRGSDIPPSMKSQEQWINQLTSNNCNVCHALGTKATREIPKSLGVFNSSLAAWERRLQAGQDGYGMVPYLARFGRQRVTAMFADWTDRIAAGELPPEPPPRPQGMERNVVITQWDWGRPDQYMHDEVTTDKRNPTINANGPVYGVTEFSSDYMLVVDPVRNTADEVRIPVRDPDTPFSTPREVVASSPYWGNKQIWGSRATPHSDMIDGKGRVWITSTIRPQANPDWCKQGSSHPSAKLFPVETSFWQVSMYDPKTKQFTLVDTCVSTHHLIFAPDANNTLWFCGVSDAVGWLNTKMFDETGDEQKSQGWTPIILDTNGNGKRDAYVEPDDPIDPTKDKRILAPVYAIGVSPSDGSVWGTVPREAFPGAIVRLNPGSNPSVTALAEIYELPFGNPKARIQGYGPRGIDIDDNGVVWVPLSSGHLGSFDRRKCKGPLNGPTATGQHCSEGWTFYPLPGPRFKGTTATADAHYFSWVDRFDTFGLGKNVPIATGNNSDSLLALLPDSGKVVILRVPYPMGFFAKGMDGRIDDPKAGWKGRGLWSTYATRAIWHVEGGKGTTSKAVKFQLRPNPLAH